MIGPKDGRNRRSRCQACSRRKIKCEGGVPCLYCTKRKYECTPPAIKDIAGVKFVISTNGCLTKEPKRGSRKSTADHPGLHLATKVPIDENCVILKHFFTSFISRNNFTGSIIPDLEGLVAGFQSSPGLCDAIIAVSTLDISRSHPSRVCSTRKDTESRALAAYQASVTSIRAEIEGNTILTSEYTLWTTFFLGLFELMYDVSGDGWIRHILYGTSKLLQLRGPEAHRTGQGRVFFITMRAFEICRALIYNEDTFLCHDEWRELMESLWEREFQLSWHPKEALFDLMVSCASLSYRVWEVVEARALTYPAEIGPRLQTLAQEGVCLRTALEAWFMMFTQHTYNSGINQAENILSAAYYHASSIFLSGIFDYRPQFLLFQTPSLSENEIQTHVTSILSNSHVALNNTNLAGILLFFPLRVAGARTKCDVQKENILEMLKEISMRSFVVANAFREDLESLWVEKTTSKPH